MIILKPLKHINELPVVDEMIKISQSLAILDAILMPEWEFRYFSFNRHWDSNQYMASLRDGEGSHYYILFELENKLTTCLGKIYCKNSLTDNSIFSEIQNVNHFEYFINEVAFENDKVSLYFFFDYSNDNWETITTVDNIPFLGVFKEKEKAYIPWAEQYYEVNIDKNIVKEIFNFKPLDEKMLSKLNPDLTLKDILADIEEIGYPLHSPK